ncbi:MAG: Gfo/Idh/MocA family oxidoreductase [Verrucomicrobiota bacterium]
MSSHETLIIGCGRLGERHVRCFHRRGRTKVSACASIATSLARLRVPCSLANESAGERPLLRRLSDSAALYTPAPLAAGMGKTTLESGLHVVVEKPLSHLLERIREFLAACDHVQRQATVAYVSSPNPGAA